MKIISKIYLLFLFLFIGFLFSLCQSFAAAGSGSGFILDFGGLLSGAFDGTSKDMIVQTHIYSMPTMAGSSDYTMQTSVLTDTKTTICGNMILEAGEDCEGDNFGGATCSSFGYDKGFLTCHNCIIQLSNCSRNVVVNNNSNRSGGGGGITLPSVNENNNQQQNTNTNVLPEPTDQHPVENTNANAGSGGMNENGNENVPIKSNNNTNGSLPDNDVVNENMNTKQVNQNSPFERDHITTRLPVVKIIQKMFVSLSTNMNADIRSLEPTLLSPTMPFSPLHTTAKDDRSLRTTCLPDYSWWLMPLLISMFVLDVALAVYLFFQNKKKSLFLKHKVKKHETK